MGSISVLSSCRAWASRGPLGTLAGCALVRVRPLEALDQCCIQEKQSEPPRAKTEAVHWMSWHLNGWGRAAWAMAAPSATSDVLDSHGSDWPLVLALQLCVAVQQLIRSFLPLLWNRIRFLRPVKSWVRFTKKSRQFLRTNCVPMIRSRKTEILYFWCHTCSV